MAVRSILAIRNAGSKKKKKRFYFDGKWKGSVPGVIQVFAFLFLVFTKKDQVEWLEIKQGIHFLNFSFFIFLWDAADCG